MIESLEMRRFRSIKQEEVDFGDLNILIGRNNSGKSTVLYALDLLINNFAEPFAFSNTESDLGNLPTNVFKHKNSGEVYLDVTIDFDQEELDRIRNSLQIKGESPEDISFFGLELKIPVRNNIEQGNVDEVEMSSTLYSDSGPLVEVKTEDDTRVRGYSGLEDVRGFPPLPKSGNTSALSPFKKIESLFQQVKSEQFFYIHPDRLQDRRIRSISDIPRHRDVGESGRFVTDVMAYNRDKTDVRDNFEKVVQWVEKFGFREPKAKIEEGADYSLQLVDEDLEVQSNVLDIGSGSNQLVSLITQSFFAPESSIMLVEEPEIHLHPKYQAGLADFFIDAQQFGDHQFFLETHSQHLLTRLQLRVAEGEIDPSQVGLFFFDKDDQGTEITQIEMDQDGEVEEPIPEFFEQDFDDVMRRMKIIREKEDSNE